MCREGTQNDQHKGIEKLKIAALHQKTQGASPGRDEVRVGRSGHLLWKRMDHAHYAGRLGYSRTSEVLRTMKDAAVLEQHRVTDQLACGID